MSAGTWSVLPATKTNLIAQSLKAAKTHPILDDAPYCSRLHSWTAPHPHDELVMAAPTREARLRSAPKRAEVPKRKP